MKKAIIFSIVFLIAITASAEESFYVKLEINEVKVGEKINFSLADASAQYGEYDSFYDVYKEGSLYDYILETYDSNQKLIEKYSLKSSRFIYWDERTESGEPTGGIKESNSGVIDAYIPYVLGNPVAFIRVDNKGVKTNFIPLPVNQLEEKFKKISLCKKENETGDLSADKCCSGLISKPTENNNFTCVNCGNKICEKNEDATFCPEDCAVSPSPAVQTSEPGKSNLFFATIIISIIVVLLLIILGFKAFQSIKNRP